MKKALKSLLEPKIKSKTHKDWRMVGYYDSPDAHSLLQLLALGKQVTKSEIVRQIVALWFKENDAVEIAAMQIKSSPAAKSPAFRKKLEKFLQKKGVTREYIDKLLKRLE